MLRQLLVLGLVVSSLPAMAQNSTTPPSQSGATQPTNAPAAEPAAPSVTYGYEADFNSRYVYRGLAYSTGSVLQPSAWVSANNYTLTIWANDSLENEPDRDRFNEVDVTLGYSRQFKTILFEPALTFYLYPHKRYPETGELALKFSIPAGPVRLYTIQTFDIIKYHGSYYGELGVSRTQDLAPSWTGTGSASISWGSSKYNEANLGFSGSTLEVGNAQFSATYTTKSGIYFRPHIGISTLIDSKVRAAAADKTLTDVGVAIGKSY